MNNTADEVIAEVTVTLLEKPEPGLAETVDELIKARYGDIQQKLKDLEGEVEHLRKCLRDHIRP